MRLLAGLVAITMAIILAPQAQADQYSFVATLDAKGVYYNDVSAVMDVGKLTCGGLRRGGTVNQAFDYIQTEGYSEREAAIIITAAAKEMCPDQQPTLRAYVDEGEV